MHAFSSRSLEPNRNFDVVLLDAEEYDGRSESAFSDYSCHLFFSFIHAKKKEQMIHLMGHHEKRSTDAERLENFNLHNDASSSIKVRALLWSKQISHHQKNKI